MKTRSFKKIAMFLGLCLLFSAGIYISLYVGAVSFTPEKKELFSTILYKLRMPRMIIAMLAGSSLALGGVVYQALLKNPLAEPYLLGVSSGAAFGAIATLLLFGSAFMSLGAFTGSVLTFLLIIFLAKLSGKISTYSLILSGVVLNSFFAALISLTISMFPRKTFGILFWLMGSLEVYDANLLWFYIVFFIITVAVLMLFSYKLDLLSLGDDEAYYLGVSVNRTKIFLFMISTFLVAFTVSLTGIIGFVGLVVPHFARYLVGARHLRLIPASIFLGAFFLLGGNAVIYSLLQNPDLPIGVFTSLLGIPFLFYIFLRKKNA
jgi:cobalamin transport system permease protein